MKRALRKSVQWILSLALVAGFSMPHASAQPGFKIKINGQTYSTNSINQDGKLMIPAVFLRKAGISVSWDERYKAVVLMKDHSRISLPSETKQAYSWTGYEWVREYLDTKTINRIDGTYIPLRYAIEKFGMKITYIPQSATIEIRTGTTEAISTFSTFSTPAAASFRTSDSEGQYWLYQLTEAEAGGESHKGKIAVAASVINRVGNPDWPNTLKEVIFQIVEVNGTKYYQYSPVMDGRIYNVKPSEDTTNAVNEALSGKDPTDGAVVFYNPDKTDNDWVRHRPVVATIGNHIFAK